MYVRCAYFQGEVASADVGGADLEAHRDPPPLLGTGVDGEGAARQPGRPRVLGQRTWPTALSPTNTSRVTGAPTPPDCSTP